MTLGQLWKLQEANLINEIKTRYNEIAFKSQINDQEATAINKLLWTATHNLRYRELRIVDEENALVSEIFIDIITHDILALVNEYKTTMYMLDFENSGKNHTQRTINPYNNTEGEFTPIQNDVLNFTDLDNASKAQSYLILNSAIIKRIYKELKEIVIVMVEGW